MRKELLIFIDPGYLDGIGHYENYGLQLRLEAQHRGVKFWHVVNRSVPGDKVAANGLTPLFLRPAFLGSVFHQPDELDFAITAFASKLHLVCRRMIKEGLQDHRITLFMYTGHPAYLQTIADVLNDALFQKLDIRFYFNLFYVDNGFARKMGCAGYLQTLSSLGQELERRDPGQKISLCADSERIRNVYDPYFNRPFSLIPIPLTSGKPAAALTEEGAQPQSPVTIGFLGYTHGKQGYPFIRRLYHDLFGSPDLADIRMCVRHNIFNTDPSNAENLRELLSQKERIDNHINFLSRPEYLDLMDRCDILLIPHSQEEYPVQTSGMFIDALSRGKVVVVPENTWLSDQLNAYGAGETFSGNSYENFLNAVTRAVRRLPDLRRDRFRNLNEFCRFHCARSLFDFLLSPRKAHGKNPLRIIRGVKRRKRISAEQLDNRIELLSLGILNSHREIVEHIYREKIKRNKSLGWHYLLDLTWIVNQIQKVPRGATILDAGAGMGLLQFLLIDLGYRVISVDFSPRHSPTDIQTLKISHRNTEFDHHYIDHLKKNYTRSHRDTDKPALVHSPEEFLALFAREKAPLILYQADLSDMALLLNASVDAVVSVSAIEHIDLAQVDKAIEECLRVLKPGGPLLATTSATPVATWYHQPSRGWCYDEEKIRDILRLPSSSPSNFDDFASIYEELSRPGNELHVQLAPFYMSSPHNGMPWGVWKPEYLPVGVCRTKPGGDATISTKVQPC